MKYTKSGALAVGAPNSLARFDSEARHASENTPNLLLLTEEGEALLERVASAMGCEWAGLKESNEVGTWLEKNFFQLHLFLSGFTFAFKKL